MIIKILLFFAMFFFIIFLFSTDNHIQFHSLFYTAFFISGAIIYGSKNKQELQNEK